jgi:hypothetical protein
MGARSVRFLELWWSSKVGRFCGRLGDVADRDLDGWRERLLTNATPQKAPQKATTTETSTTEGKGCHDILILIYL